MPTERKPGHATIFYLFETIVDGRPRRVIRFQDEKLICVEEGENGVVMVDKNPLIRIENKFTHL